MFNQFTEHSKCLLANKNVKQELCHFCLIRSLVSKCKSSKGRDKIKPVEFLCIAPPAVMTEPVNVSVNIVLHQLCNSLPALKQLLQPKWNCSDCSIQQGDNLLINLSGLGKDGEDLVVLAAMKDGSKAKQHVNHHGLGELEFNSNVKICIFENSCGMTVNTSDPVQFGGHTWTCKSLEVSLDAPSV